MQDAHMQHCDLVPLLIEVYYGEFLQRNLGLRVRDLTLNDSTMT